MRPFILAAALAALAPSIAFAQAPQQSEGERIFRTQCGACHQLGPTARNAVGPQLNGIFGRRAGSIEGFRYSNAYRTPAVTEKTWNPDNFRVYIRNPREVTPGTSMVYAGMRNEDQITQLIQHLQSFDAQGQRR
jgi:cytochrome c